MKSILTFAAVLWVGVLAGAVWARQGGAAPVWTTVVYAAGATVCHQRPDRSFATGGVVWPVCARCSGLYLAAPVGALLALPRRRQAGAHRRRLAPLFIAALPTVGTIAIEWLGLAPVGSLARATAALPLGAAIAFTLVRVADEN